MDTAIRRTIDYYVNQEGFGGARGAHGRHLSARARRSCMSNRGGAGAARAAYGWLPWLALAAAWFATLQVRPLLDPDEGRYAEIPREMLAQRRLGDAALRWPEILREAAAAVLGDRRHLCRLFGVHAVELAAVDGGTRVRVSAAGVCLGARGSTGRDAARSPHWSPSR